jgi:hypothetical protein
MGEYHHARFPAYETAAVAALYVGIGGLVLGAAGTGVSLYGSSQSASAQKSAASSNAALQRQQATASAAVARYQAELNYKTAMAQAQMHDSNAQALHQSARSTESQGFEQENRMVEKDSAINSAAKASYGASGVTTDSGAPTVVAAYNAGQQQLARMDQAYTSNVQAMDTDWKGSMETYQAALTRETAKQFQYAGEMADWSKTMGIAGVGVQQQAANNQADAIASAGIASAISSVGQAASSFGSASYYARNDTGSLMNAAPTWKPNGTQMAIAPPYSGLR